MTVCGIKHADGVCVMGKCPHIKTCCPVVWDKSGKPLTNEEWFCSLSTEEKARWIAEEKLCRCYFIFPSMEEAIQDVMEWLKEMHK